MYHAEPQINHGRAVPSLQPSDPALDHKSMQIDSDVTRQDELSHNNWLDSVDPGRNDINNCVENSCINLSCTILFNARSISNKLPELHALLSSMKYDIVFITESWLNPNIPDSVVLFHSRTPLSPEGGCYWFGDRNWSKFEIFRPHREYHQSSFSSSGSVV